MPAATFMFALTNHPGLIVNGATKTLINGLPAARLSDTHVCLLPPLVGPHPPSKIVKGSSSVLIEGLAAARQGDSVGCGAVISLGSPNVIIGG